MHVTTTKNKKSMNLKESKEAYMEGFSGRRGKKKIIIIISKIKLIEEDMHHKVVCDYQSRVDSVLARCLRVQFLFAKQVSILQLFSFAIMNNIRQIPT